MGSNHRGKLLANLFGGTQYVGYMITVVRLRVTQLLMRQGMTADESLQLATQASGGTHDQNSQIVQMLQGVDDESAIDQMADCMGIHAQKRLAHLRFTVPVLLIAIFGGCLALVYSLILFLPILSLLEELQVYLI